MGATCCSSEESLDTNITELRQRPMYEEVVQETGREGLSIPAISRKGEQMEFQIKVTKTYGKTRLGIDVDLTDGFGLLIDQVGEGLIKDWNQNHPELAAMKGDRIVAVNGVRGDPAQITEVCKNQAVLQIFVQRT
eukprot:symbB.v1.2.008998.t1/scaffold565.1/size187815/11